MGLGIAFMTKANDLNICANATTCAMIILAFTMISILISSVRSFRQG